LGLDLENFSQNYNFSVFFACDQKNLIRSGQKVPRSKTGQPLIYCASKVCTGRVRSGPLFFTSKTEVQGNFSTLQGLKLFGLKMMKTIWIKMISGASHWVNESQIDWLFDSFWYVEELITLTQFVLTFNYSLHCYWYLTHLLFELDYTDWIVLCFQ